MFVLTCNLCRHHDSVESISGCRKLVLGQLQNRFLIIKKLRTRCAHPIEVRLSVYNDQLNNSKQNLDGHRCASYSKTESLWPFLLAQ